MFNGCEYNTSSSFYARATNPRVLNLLPLVLLFYSCHVHMNLVDFTNVVVGLRCVIGA
jgi:hypothetical protein